MAEVPFTIDSFPAPVQRGDREDVGCVEDRNAVRGPDSNSIEQRAGTRVMTVLAATVPLTSPNPPTNGTLGGSDTVHEVTYTGSQSFLTIATNQNCPNGPRLGESLIRAILPIGGILATPGAGTGTEVEAPDPDEVPWPAPAVGMIFGGQPLEAIDPYFLMNNGAFPNLSLYGGPV